MKRRPNEDPDLAMVEELIFAPRALALERFTREETLRGRTPDFRVRRQQELVAFCEVKSPRDDWLDEQLDAAQPGQIVGGARNDPIFNRIARHVEKAVTQFDAVNPDCALLNILVFVNHDDASHYGDLHETITGLLLTDDGGRHPTMMHIAQGRLGQARQRIDLYAWVDAKTRRVQGYIFNDADRDRAEFASGLLGLDHGKIKR
ncbi:MAG TPA: hypothetical protein VJ476_15515 [Rhizomicrobium sp.]|nr:hypothetical protein [Rhizomicrobium sp.]